MEDIKLVLDAMEHTHLGKRISDYKVVVKCPICGEGSKHHDHAHCYVGMINNGPPLVYHCFMNECSGVVTPEFLRSLDIYDNELENILNIFNKSYSKNNAAERRIHYVKKKKENIIIPEIKDNDLNQMKLHYMQYRLGVRFKYEHLQKFHIIFSLYDFLNENQIVPNPNYKKSKFLDILDRDYVGFLTTGSDYIVFRNTQDNKNLRYFKYDIFGSVSNANILYVLPTTCCDIFADSVNLNISEGPFDTLGVYCHLYKGEKINNIYAACCGSGYLAAIKYFLKLGFIHNLNVNIYSDSDKKPSYYKSIKIFEDIPPWVNNISIYYNTLSKDYGVPRKEINVEKIDNRLATGKRR
jgi:hypothetical protein